MVSEIIPVSKTIFKVTVKRVKSKHETRENHGEKNCPFVNIYHCSAKRDLKRTEMLVDWKDVGNSGEGEDDGNGVKAFGN